jgi:hypothetical protein
MFFWLYAVIELLGNIGNPSVYKNKAGKDGLSLSSMRTSCN